MTKLHKILKKNIYNKVDISFKRDTDDTLLKRFENILITDTDLDSNAIGILKIPVSSLVADSTNQKEYDVLNNFVIHFPSFKYKLNFLLNTKAFDEETKLFFDNIELLDSGNVVNPKMDGYNLVTASLDNYTIYLTKRKQFKIFNTNRTDIIAIDPLNNYDPKTNSSQIVITK